MTEERAGAWTRTSRVISARPEELYAAFLDPTALIDWLPPAEMTGEVHEFDARVRGRRTTRPARDYLWSNWPAASNDRMEGSLGAALRSNCAAAAITWFVFPCSPAGREPSQPAAMSCRGCRSSQHDDCWRRPDGERLRPVIWFRTGRDTAWPD